MAKTQGTIRSLKRGFGFIADAMGFDYFFHASAVEQTGPSFDELQVNQPVEFTPIEGPKGPRAIEVRVLPGGRASLQAPLP